MFFVLRALRYIDLFISKEPPPYDTKSVNIIGRNNSTLEVVSNIITASEYVILVAPASIAVAPNIAKVGAGISFPSTIGNIA